MQPVDPQVAEKKNESFEYVEDQILPLAISLQHGFGSFGLS